MTAKKTMQASTVQASTVQASTVQASTVQASTVQASTEQELVEYVIAPMTRTPAFFNYVNGIMPTVFEKAVEWAEKQMKR